MVNLTDPIYTDTNAARKHLEALRWPNGPHCPHCGETEALTKLAGKSTRPGVFKCRSCRKPFSVTVGTVFERSHIPLNKWILATHLLAASKKGISSHQLHRMLGVTYKTAWFMAHRIRLAMAPTKDESGPLGGEGKIVEADETYLGKSPKTRKPKGHIAHQRHAPVVLTLDERGGNIRSVYLDHQTARSAVYEHLADNTKLVTDAAAHFKGISILHESVDHSKFQWR